jgi:exonuclease VII small subunit
MAAAVKNPVCTICDETFKDGRGLSGHIQWKHQDLSEDEREELMEEGMSRGRESAAGEAADDLNTAALRYTDPVMQAVERVRQAKDRLEEAEDRMEALMESSGGTGVGPFGTKWMNVKREVKQRCKEEIQRREDEVERRVEQLNEAIHQEVSDRE